ncbi:MAG: protein-glutamate O-methyltransferase CheR [Planctomycetota bacterium]
MSSLSAQQYQFVRDLVRKRSGIVLDEGKNYLIEFRLSELARASGQDSAHALLSAAESTPSSPVTDRIVHAMATHETSFFRDQTPFDALNEVILPMLRRSRREDKRIRIWSAACSTGQEPFSIAMTILEKFNDLASWDISILATDISELVIERARRGRFSSLEVGRGLPSMYLQKYFVKDGNDWALHPEVTELVTFRSLNLLNLPVRGEPFDLIFLRNVLIYFSPETKRNVLQAIRPRLRPDGFLFLGAPEMTLAAGEAFETVPEVKTACFRLKE